MIDNVQSTVTRGINSPHVNMSCPPLSPSLTLCVDSGDQVLCKHLLAAKLASALGKCAESAVTDEQLRDILAELH